MFIYLTSYLYPDFSQNHYFHLVKYPVHTLNKQLLIELVITGNYTAYIYIYIQYIQYYIIYLYINIYIYILYVYDIRILARSSCVSRLQPPRPVAPKTTSRLVWVGHGLHQPSQQLQPRSFRAFAQHRRQRRLAVRRRVAAVRICLRWRGRYRGTPRGSGCDIHQVVVNIP